jgi:hypothetical protein
MITSSFNCKQQELYDICRTGWTACSDNLADFTAFSPMYDAAFITDRVNEVGAAEALPDEQQRDEDSRTFRAEMVNKATECLNLWQRLKRYITKAYPEDQLDIKLTAAGQASYRDAARENWSSLKKLTKDGSDFLANNTAALTANNNMPAAFVLTFATAKGAFDALYQNFLSAGQNDEIETQTKTIANNDIHAKLMSMFLDGQELYKDDAAKVKLFTFTEVLLTVSGAGQAGIKGTVTDSNGNPLPGVSAKLLGPDIETQTDEDGKFSYTIAAKTYGMLFTKEGFQSQQIDNIELQPGVTKTIDVTMVPTP